MWPYYNLKNIRLSDTVGSFIGNCEIWRDTYINYKEFSSKFYKFTHFLFEDNDML